MPAPASSFEAKELKAEDAEDILLLLSPASEAKAHLDGLLRSDTDELRQQPLVEPRDSSLVDEDLPNAVGPVLVENFSDDGRSLILQTRLDHVDRADGQEERGELEVSKRAELRRAVNILTRPRKRQHLLRCHRGRIRTLWTQRCGRSTSCFPVARARREASTGGREGRQNEWKSQYAPSRV